jgi:hypothetical protein
VGELIALELPVPPDAVRLFGYPGQARFVGFFWEPAGDEVVYDDGRLSGTGASFVFLTYRRHPAVGAHLEPYNLGYSDLEAEHCLVIDSEENHASIGTLANAWAFLRGQHPKQPEFSAAQVEEARRLLEESFFEGWREVRVDPHEVEKLLIEQRRAFHAVTSYLNQFLPES